MFDLIDVLRCCKVPYLYQKRLDNNKMVPSIKIVPGGLRFLFNSYNLSPEYYVRKSKYPLRYERMEQSSKLEELVKQYIEVNGV